MVGEDNRQQQQQRNGNVYKKQQQWLKLWRLTEYSLSDTPTQLFWFQPFSFFFRLRFVIYGLSMFHLPQFPQMSKATLSVRVAGHSW